MYYDKLPNIDEAKKFRTLSIPNHLLCKVKENVSLCNCIKKLWKDTQNPVSVVRGRYVMG